jgi:hypothetical protein
LQLCEWWVDHGRVEDLLQGVFGAELGVRVALAVFVRDAGDFGEIFGFGAVPSEGD